MIGANGVQGDGSLEFRRNLRKIERLTEDPRYTVNLAYAMGAGTVRPPLMAGVRF